MSGLRTKELTDLAAEKGLKLLSLPEVYDVRWTENTTQLLTSILTSWNVLVLYFLKSNESEARGYLKLLTSKDNLYLLSWVADVLGIFSRFQKNLQNNNTTILDMSNYVEQVIKQLNRLKIKPLARGWVEAMNEQIVITEDDKYFLKEIELTTNERRAVRHNLYVSEKRDVDAVINELLQSLVNLTEQRYEQDQSTIRVLKQFADFNEFSSLN